MGDITSVGLCQDDTGEPSSHILLVSGMDIVGFTDIDDHRLSGVR
tara:strand:+ start:591 stop:725 length:135 start_codon:yes stop_codon:yes gene_type:complete